MDNIPKAFLDWCLEHEVPGMPLFVTDISECEGVVTVEVTLPSKSYRFTVDSEGHVEDLDDFLSGKMEPVDQTELNDDGGYIQ